MAELAHLAPDWNGEGAPAIDMTIAARLLDWLSRLMPPGCPDPTIVPTPHGGVQAEWHEAGFDIEMEMCPCCHDVTPDGFVRDLRGGRYSADVAGMAELMNALAQLARRSLASVPR